jgi:hypothetical protein
MAQKLTAKTSPAPAIAIAFIIAAVFIVYIVGVVSHGGAGSTQSKASRKDFLTTGDDALSLEQDLKNLEKNPSDSDEAVIDTMQ